MPIQCPLLEFDLHAPRMIMVADLSTYFASNEVLVNTFEHARIVEQIYAIFRKVLDTKDLYFHLQDEIPCNSIRSKT